jgi:hypothetical protein
VAAFARELRTAVPEEPRQVLKKATAVGDCVAVCADRTARRGYRETEISDTKNKRRRLTMRLPIANGYGNVDVRNGTPEGYSHVPGKRLQPLCRKLGIDCADALVGWGGRRRFPKPVFDGVVLAATDKPRLLAEIEKRKLRNPPEKAEAARRRRVRKRQSQADDLAEMGIYDPSSRTARWYKKGEIDSYEAQLISFKTMYRHEHTDYETIIEQLHAEARAARGMFLNNLQHDAREIATEYPIPDSWESYLDTYDFPHPEIAFRLSQVLKSPQKSHPVWFCEAILAVKRTGLENLTYETVRQAVAKWREERAL